MDSDMILVIAVFLLIVLCAGDPDLLDALITLINKQ